MLMLLEVSICLREIKLERIELNLFEMFETCLTGMLRQWHSLLPKGACLKNHQ